MDTQGVLSRLGRLSGRVLLGTVVVVFALASSVGVAKANSITYDINQDGCSGGGCNPGSSSMGTILLTDNGTNDVQVTITLIDPLEFLHTGIGATFAFNLDQTGIGGATISATNLDSNFALASGSAGSIHMAGFGNFDYGINLTSSGGNNALDASPLTFDITCSSCGLTVDSFATLSSPSGLGSPTAYFALDVSNPTNGNTGPIGAPDPGTTVVPEAGTISLLGTGLLGLFGLAFYRRRSTSV